MSILRNRAEQLAELLRRQITDGQVVEPLPNTREWSKRLEVGRNTLGTALRILQQEGWVSHSGTRGYRLASANGAADSKSVRKLVRFINYWPDYRGHHNAGSSLMSVLEERLHPQGIEIRNERWLDSHFHAFARSHLHPSPAVREFLLVPSLDAKLLRGIAHAGRACLLLGTPPEGIALPSITCDWQSVIRHSTLYLARRNFRHIVLLVRQSHAATHANYCDTFLKTCASAPNAPIQAEILRPSLDLASQVLTARRLGARLKERLGIIVCGPLAVSATMTVLLQRGVRIPDQVEIVYSNSLPELLMVDPVPVHYPYPTETMARVVARTIIDYFETGKKPRIHKVIPIEMVNPRDAS